MLYKTTVSQKGQVVIPQAIRRFLNVDKNNKIVFEMRDDRREVVIKSVPRILDLAGIFKPRKVVSAVKARGKFEKNYARK